MVSHHRPTGHHPLFHSSAHASPALTTRLQQACQHTKAPCFCLQGALRRHPSLFYYNHDTVDCVSTTTTPACSRGLTRTPNQHDTPRRCSGKHSHKRYNCDQAAGLQPTGVSSHMSVSKNAPSLHSCHIQKHTIWGGLGLWKRGGTSAAASCCK